MRLLLDEMYNPKIAVQLRLREHDVVELHEVDLAGSTDRHVFVAAQESRRAVLTENVADFVMLDREWRGRGNSHWGLIFTSNRSFPRGSAGALGALVGAIDVLLLSHPDDSQTNQIIWLRV